MSAGHAHEGAKFSAKEIAQLAREALANPLVRKRLERKHTLDIDHDIVYLGSSSIGGATVYLDRHLRVARQPHGHLLIGGRFYQTTRPLTRHERLEQACEDELGWVYGLAHRVATWWEHELVRAQLTWIPEDKRVPAYEAALKPYIKADEHEKLIRVPGDLDIRPLLAPPMSKALVDHVRAAMEKSRAPHAEVGYVAASKHTGKHCAGCSMYVPADQGYRGCAAVRPPIDPAGWCRLFERRREAA